MSMYFEPREIVMDREQAIERLLEGIKKDYSKWSSNMGMIKEFNEKPIAKEVTLPLQQDCGICMSEFEPNEAIVALGCSKGDTKHIFHKSCIDKMMDFNKKKQPPL